VLRERVDEVCQAVEHEHGPIPRRAGRGVRAPPQRSVFLLSRSDAHLDGRVDERVERALDRRAILLAAATAAAARLAVAVTIVIAVGFGCV